MKTLSCCVLVCLLLSNTAGCCCPPPDSNPCAQDRGPTAVELAPPARAKRDAASYLTPDDRIVVALSKKRVKGLDWEEVNLDAAVTYLQAITGHKFHISPKVREEMFEDVIISAQLDDVSVKTILESVVTEPFEMRWEVRKGVIWILTNEEIDGDIRLRYFDVKDLSVNIQNFSYNKFIDEPVKAPSGPPARDLADDIRKAVHPTYWDREDVTIEVRNGILIVRGSKAVHDAIDRWLASERERRAVNDAGKALQAKFAKTNVNLSVRGQSLRDVIRTLQIQTGFNLMIDPRSVAEVERNPISVLELKDVPLTTALTMLASYAGPQYVWLYRNNVAALTHKEHVQ